MAWSNFACRSSEPDEVGWASSAVMTLSDTEDPNLGKRMFLSKHIACPTRHSLENRTVFGRLQQKYRRVGRRRISVVEARPH